MNDHQISSPNLDTVKNSHGKRTRSAGDGDDDMEEFMPLSKRINNIHLSPNGTHITAPTEYSLEQSQRQEILSSIGSPSRMNEVMGYAVFPSPDSYSSQVPASNSLGCASNMNMMAGQNQSLVHDPGPHNQSSLNQKFDEPHRHTHNGQMPVEASGILTAPCSHAVNGHNHNNNMNSQLHICHPNAEPVPVPECARVTNLYEEMQFDYQPQIPASLNPHYFEQNRQLFFLYLDRMRRNNLIPHSDVFQRI